MGELVSGYILGIMLAAIDCLVMLAPLFTDLWGNNRRWIIVAAREERTHPIDKISNRLHFRHCYWRRVLKNCFCAARMKRDQI